MSLRGFHIIFIIASILLSSIFALWAMQYYVEHQLVGYLVTALMTLFVTIGLILYLIKFTKKVSLKNA